MVVTGLLGGALCLGLAAGYARWLDDAAVADAVLWVLLMELILGVLGYGFLEATDTALVINLGSISLPGTYPDFNLIFAFDDVSAALWAVLATALVGCFYFLLEYFDFDAQGGYGLLRPWWFQQEERRLS